VFLAGWWDTRLQTGEQCSLTVVFYAPNAQGVYLVVGADYLPLPVDDQGIGAQTWTGTVEGLPSRIPAQLFPWNLDGSSQLQIGLGAWPYLNVQ